MSKISFTTMGTPELDGPQSIQLARKYGFDGIDLRVSDFKGELPTSPQLSDIKQIRNSLDTEGIDLVSIFVYNEKGDDDPASWKVMEDSLLTYMDIAADLNCPAVRMFGGDPQISIDPEDHIKRTADVIKNVFARHDSDIKIRLQNHVGGFFFMQGKELHRLVDDKRFDQAFSPDHCYIMGESFEKVFPVAKETTGQIFISDLIFDHSANVWSRTQIGGGDVPLLDSIKCLGEDFDGYLTLKWDKIWFDYLADYQDSFPHFIKWIGNIRKPYQQ